MGQGLGVVNATSVGVCQQVKVTRTATTWGTQCFDMGGREVGV